MFRKRRSALLSCALASAVFFERDSSALVMRPEPHEQSNHNCARLGVGASSEGARVVDGPRDWKPARSASECEFGMQPPSAAIVQVRYRRRRKDFPAVGGAGSGARIPQRRCRENLETGRGTMDGGRAEVATDFGTLPRLRKMPCMVSVATRPKRI